MLPARELCSHGQHASSSLMGAIVLDEPVEFLVLFSRSVPRLMNHTHVQRPVAIDTAECDEVVPASCTDSGWQ